MQVFAKAVVVLFPLLGRVYQYKCSRYMNLGQGIGLVEVTHIESVYTNDRLRCVKECLQRRKCIGFEHQTSCYLFARFLYGRDYHYSRTDLHVQDIQNWPPTIVGTCATRPCLDTMKCIPTTPIHTCVPFCGKLDSPIPWPQTWNTIGHTADWDKGAYTGFVAERRLSCKPTYLPESSISTAECLENSTWGKLTGLKCIKIRTCKQIRKCNSRYPDGVYKVHSDLELMNVTCSNMESQAPTTDTSVAPDMEAIFPDCGYLSD